MKQNLFKKTLFIIGLMLLVFVISAVWLLRKVYTPNVNLKNEQFGYIYIHTGSNIQDVTNSLYEGGFLLNRSSFEWLAEKKGYDKNIKAGKYKVKNGMSNNELINMLRSGRQERVKISFSNIRQASQLAGIYGRELEADSLKIMQLFTDKQFLSAYGVTKETALALFIPNTYFFFWNSTAEQVFKRMHNEFKIFWNSERLAKANTIGLSPLEIITLASIVNEETNLSDEFPVIAGVYINRIKKGMPLQADPTVKYAVGDFTIKRVLTKHIQTESPYNTYKNKGLPPGPISVPSIKAIDGVLNFEKHKYLYFCAKSDMSGYHAFAKTLVEHNNNARMFQSELNRRRIFK